MILLLIFLGLGILAIGGIGVMCYTITQNPAVKEVIGAFGSILNAPGRRELIAAGCDGAMVIDMRAFAEIAKKDPDADPEEIARMQDTVFVNCVFNTAEPLLTCAQVAKAYRDAVPDGPPHVNIFVQTAGKSEPICSGSYDNDAKYLGEAEAPPRSPIGPTPWQTPPPTSR